MSWSLPSRKYVHMFEMQKSLGLYSCYFLNCVCVTYRGKKKKKPSVQIISISIISLTWVFSTSNTLPKTYIFILMPSKTFTDTFFCNRFPEDGKIANKAKLPIKILHKKHASFMPENSRVLFLLIVVLITWDGSSKGYLSAMFKHSNHILVAVLGIQIPRQLLKSYPQSTFNVQYKHLQTQPQITSSRRQPHTNASKVLQLNRHATFHLPPTTVLQRTPWAATVLSPEWFILLIKWLWNVTAMNVIKCSLCLKIRSTNTVVKTELTFSGLDHFSF